MFSTRGDHLLEGVNLALVCLQDMERPSDLKFNKPLDNKKVQVLLEKEGEGQEVFHSNIHSIYNQNRVRIGL